MKRIAIFCVLAVLLSFCGCQEEPVRMTESEPAQTEILTSHQEPQKKQEKAISTEKAPPDSEKLPTVPVGSGFFADPGELSAEQQDLILRFMGYYYESLAALSLQAPDDVFSPEAQVQLAGNIAIWEYVIGIRSMQQQDLGLTAYEYDLTVQSAETGEDGRVTVRVSEHCIQNFTAYPDVDTESFGVIHQFQLCLFENRWLIESHMQMEGLNWMIMGGYGYRRAGSEQMTPEEASSYFAKRKDDLLSQAQAAVSARGRGESAVVECDESYDRLAAVDYAYEWVGQRSDDWADYSRSGGNCQNFMSQCLYAGGIPMDIQSPGIWKWYGTTPDNLAWASGRSASWSSVQGFLDYVNGNKGFGLSATSGDPYYSGQIGDILHLGSNGDSLRHTVMITDVVTDAEGQVQDYLVCSNTADLVNFPASAYPYAYQLLIRIHGWNW